MSIAGQRPDHLIIREYIHELQAARRITRETLTDAFVPVYLEMIPEGPGAPDFEPVHRHDSMETIRRKEDANTKKLWRAIEGKTIFPLVFGAPLVPALERIAPGMGVELQKRLLHNAGLLHLPIDASDRAPVVYANWLKEFSEANAALVEDMSCNGVLDSARTRKEVLDVIESSLQVLRELDKNTAE